MHSTSREYHGLAIVVPGFVAILTFPVSRVGFEARLRRIGCKPDDADCLIDRSGVLKEVAVHFGSRLFSLLLQFHSRVCSLATILLEAVAAGDTSSPLIKAFVARYSEFDVVPRNQMVRNHLRLGFEPRKLGKPA